MVINRGLNILDIANSDLINGLSNIAQFYNIYQNTKAGTYVKLNNVLSQILEELKDINSKMKEVRI